MPPVPTTASGIRSPASQETVSPGSSVGRSVLGDPIAALLAALANSKLTTDFSGVHRSDVVARSKETTEVDAWSSKSDVDLESGLTGFRLEPMPEVCLSRESSAVSPDSPSMPDVHDPSQRSEWVVGLGNVEAATSTAESETGEPGDVPNEEACLEGEERQAGMDWLVESSQLLQQAVKRRQSKPEVENNSLQVIKGRSNPKEKPCLLSRMLSAPEFVPRQQSPPPPLVRSEPCPPVRRVCPVSCRSQRDRRRLTRRGHGWLLQASMSLELGRAKSR